MPPCWSFSFQNYKFLTVGRVKRVNMRHGAKFRGDQSNHCWDMTIFRFVKMAAAAILDFSKVGILRVERAKRVKILLHGLQCFQLGKADLQSLDFTFNRLCMKLFSERELTFTFAICCRPSVCLSVVCDVRAPYSGGSNFWQYFYGIRYLGHPMTSTENFTEMVTGEPLRRGS